MKKQAIILVSLFFMFLTLFGQSDYKFKVYMDISNGPETRRMIDKSLWPIVSDNCDGPWLLTWELRKGTYFIDATYGMERKAALGAAFKNKEAIIEVPQHWSWDSQEIPLHEQVALDCGFTRKGTVYYYEDASVTSVLFVQGVQIAQEAKPTLFYPTVDFVMNKHSAYHEVYILAREWRTDQPPQKQFDKSLDACHGVCFEFQVPYKSNTPPTNMWAGIRYALQNNKKVMLLMPAPNNINDKECYTYLDGVKKLFNDVKQNVGEDALRNENLIFIPNTYDWDKKYYRIVPEVTPDGQIANTGTGAALWLLMQRNPNLYNMPAQRKNPVENGWNTTEIGTNPIAGEVFQYNDTLVIRGGGYDGSAVQQKDSEPFLGTTADKQFFMYKRVTGDFEISGRVLLTPLSDRWGRVGFMARESFDAGSKFAAMMVSSGAGTTLQYRSDLNSKSLMANSANLYITPVWLKLKRVGSVLTAYTSGDGTNWTQSGTPSVTLSDELYLGLMTSSHAQTGALAFNIDLTKYPAYVSNLQIQANVLSALKTPTFDTGEVKCSIDKLKNKLSIHYDLKNAEQLSVTLYDIQGRLIQTCCKNKKISAGKSVDSYYVTEKIAVGNYICSIKSDKRNLNIKL